MAFAPAGLAEETVLFSEGKAESASQAAPGTASQTREVPETESCLGHFRANLAVDPSR